MEDTTAVPPLSGLDGSYWQVATTRRTPKAVILNLEQAKTPSPIKPRKKRVVNPLTPQQKARKDKRRQQWMEKKRVETQKKVEEQKSDMLKRKEFLDQKEIVQRDGIEIFNGIFVGGRLSAMNYELLTARNVVAIVNVTTEVRCYFEKENCFQYKKIPVNDAIEDNLSQYFNEAAEFISNAKKTGNVLIHCKMGQSRSCTILVAFAMKSLNMTLDATMKQLNERHVCVGINDGFKRQLMEYERQLFSASSYNFFCNRLTSMRRSDPSVYQPANPSNSTVQVCNTTEVSSLRFFTANSSLPLGVLQQPTDQPTLPSNKETPIPVPVPPSFEQLFDWINQQKAQNPNTTPNLPETKLPQPTMPVNIPQPTNCEIQHTKMIHTPEATVDSKTECIKALEEQVVFVKHNDAEMDESECNIDMKEKTEANDILPLMTSEPKNVSYEKMVTEIFGSDTSSEESCKIVKVKKSRRPAGAKKENQDLNSIARQMPSGVKKRSALVLQETLDGSYWQNASPRRNSKVKKYYK